MGQDNIVVTSSSLPSDKFDSLEKFLEVNGLPYENIIANSTQRSIMENNLPFFLQSLPPESKKNANYLSKFVAGAAVGLYDAALNYIWNEVIVNLRQKADIYGLDMFFDAAVGEKKRDSYNTKEDLSGLKDKILLDTCRKLELISDLVYKKLSHILTMRNDIGASHPNEYSINSYELLGWLQTCINDVIMENPSKASITIKSIVDNIKSNKEKIQDSTIELISIKIKDLSSVMTGNLLVSLFGIFTSDKTEKITRENILKLAPLVWNHCTDDVKYSLGEKLDGHRLKLEEDRQKLGELFFKTCNGERYYTNDSRVISLSNLTDSLEEAHLGWDNYYNEPPIALEIMKFIKISSDIPKEREDKIIKVFLTCRIGNGRGYCRGVSPGAQIYYDEFFKLLDKEQIIKLLNILETHELRSLVLNKIGSERCIEILHLLKSPLIGDRLNEIIDYIIKNKENLYYIFKTKEYKDLVKSIQ